MQSPNLPKICCFLRMFQENNGDMHQWKWLKACIYPLSSNEYDRVNKSQQHLLVYKLRPVFSYKFPNICYEGVTDEYLERDIDKLVFFGYISRKRETLGDEQTAHYTYTLTQKGERLADEVVDHLDSDQLKGMKLLIDEVRNLDSETIVAKYAKVWCQRMAAFLSEEIPKLSRGETGTTMGKESALFTNQYVLPYELTKDMIGTLRRSMKDYEAKDDKVAGIGEFSFDDDVLSIPFKYQWKSAMLDYGEAATDFSKLIEKIVKELFWQGRIDVEKQGILRISYPFNINTDLDWYTTYVRDVFRRILQKPLWTIGVMDFLETQFIGELDVDEGSHPFSREFWPWHSYLDTETDRSEAIYEAFSNSLQFGLFNSPTVEFWKSDEIRSALRFLTAYKNRILMLYEEDNTRKTRLVNMIDQRIRQFEASIAPPESIQLLREIATEVKGF